MNKLLIAFVFSLFALAFALEQLHQNMGDLVDRAAEMSSSAVS